MKKLSKEDLSLDKQEVSSLGGPNGMNYATDGSPNPTVQTTLDSHGPICCDFSHNETCGKTCELSKCFNCPGSGDCPVSETCPGTETCPDSETCPETNDETTCAVSVDNETGCIIPIPETQHC